MSETKIGSVTVQFDTRVPAVYLYLRDPKEFRSHQSKQVADGVIVDLDERGGVVGIELLGPQDLEAVLRIIQRQQALERLRDLMLLVIRGK